MAGNKIVIGVAGAGTMGAGIAQIAASSGHKVIVYDLNDGALRAALRQIDGNLGKQLERQSKSFEDRRMTIARIETTGTLDRLSECEFVVEAVVEELFAKKELLRRLEKVVSSTCVLSTNTSSLSVTAISSALQARERFLGTHFFNPATVMPLVEFVRTEATSDQTIRSARETIEGWGKLSVIVQDTPGFVVNRIARPFYIEALKILEEGVADVATIDSAMRQIGGFKMGPFELMDLIGNDVNYAVSESIFASFYYDPRFRPSHIQRRMVEAGHLGRKSGRGFYEYNGHFQKPQPGTDQTQAQAIADRILFMIFNEAADAVLHRIASVVEIDLAMVKAANYPHGPLQWADEAGINNVVAGLEALQDEFGDDRYRANPLLKRMAKAGDKFYRS